MHDAEDAQTLELRPSTTRPGVSLHHRTQAFYACSVGRLFPITATQQIERTTKTSIDSWADLGLAAEQITHRMMSQAQLQRRALKLSAELREPLGVPRLNL
jgi:hypothetical protein